MKNAVSLLSVTLFFLFSSCLSQFSHPLTKTFENDPLLEGAWRGELDPGEIAVIHIQRGARSDYVLSGQITNQGKTEKIEPYVVRLSKIKDRTYWNMEVAEPKQKKYFVVLHYRIASDGKTLNLKQLDDKKIGEMVRNKSLSGKIQKGRWFDSTVITASSSELTRVFAESSLGALFEEKTLRFNKIKAQPFAAHP
ncbi:MAG: hypothetical protein HY541_06530 [Deltaproteobacteria bacterium]|nr:hypothetical protein [Deltaproteobacteria bacterium]